MTDIYRLEIKRADGSVEDREFYTLAEALAHGQLVTETVPFADLKQTTWEVFKETGE